MTARRWTTLGGHQSWSIRPDLWGAGRFVQIINGGQVLADWGHRSRVVEAVQRAEADGLGAPGVAEAAILSGVYSLTMQVDWCPLEES